MNAKRILRIEDLEYIPDEIIIVENDYGSNEYIFELKIKRDRLKEDDIPYHNHTIRGEGPRC